MANYYVQNINSSHRILSEVTCHLLVTYCIYHHHWYIYTSTIKVLHTPKNGAKSWFCTKVRRKHFSGLVKWKVQPTISKCISCSTDWQFHRIISVTTWNLTPTWPWKNSWLATVNARNRVDYLKHQNWVSGKLTDVALYFSSSSMLRGHSNSIWNPRFILSFSPSA
jgi:hypothetical protein